MGYDIIHNFLSHLIVKNIWMSSLECIQSLGFYSYTDYIPVLRNVVCGFCSVWILLLGRVRLEKGECDH